MSQGTTKGIPIDTDTALSGNSNALVPSQRAVKTYTDTLVSLSATNIPLSNMANLTGPTVIGKDTGTGAPIALTPAQIKTVLGAGTVLQVVTKSITTQLSGTTIIPRDGTPPQSGEGVSLIDSASFTPMSANSKICVTISSYARFSLGSNDMALAIFVDSDASATDATVISTNSASCFAMSIGYTFVLDAGSTSARVYKIRFGCGNAGTIQNYDAVFSGFGISSKTATMVITEVAV